METNKAGVLIQRFNETIDQWIVALDNYTLEMLHQKPRPGSWSVGQVYVHITDDTKYFIGQMSLALASNADSEKDMHPDARSLFQNNGFPDMLITGPATDDTVPQPKSKEELNQSLVATRQKANRLCAIYDLSVSTGKTRHPGLLFFSALEWLQFAEMHLRHHFRQKKRIDEKLFKL
jgi:hypothetical protein